MVTTRTATVESVVTHARKRGWRLCALLLLPIVTTANALELEPNLSVGVLHTDNLTLSRENPEAQTIYVLRPSLLFTRASNRLTAAVLYQVEGYRYQERGDSEAYDSLDARMTFEPIPDRFMLNFAANRMQVVRDPENTVPMDDFAISINRLELSKICLLGPSSRFPSVPMPLSAATSCAPGSNTTNRVGSTISLGTKGGYTSTTTVGAAV